MPTIPPIPPYSHHNRSKTPAKFHAPAPKNMSLGLEDEVDFGSDEDLMDDVGEIHIPDTTSSWYPGRPESPPPPSTTTSFRGKYKKDKDKEERSTTAMGLSETHHKRITSSSSKDTASISGKSKSHPPIPTFLGRNKPSKSKGLADARLVMAPAPTEFGSTIDLTAVQRGERDRGETDQSSVYSLAQGGASSHALSLKQDKSKNRMFGRLFGRKNRAELVPPTPSMLTAPSVESLADKSSDTCEYDPIAAFLRVDQIFSFDITVDPRHICSSPTSCRSFRKRTYQIYPNEES